MTTESTAHKNSLLKQFLAAIPTVAKTSVNPHFKNRYAPLDAWLEAINVAMEKHPVVLREFCSIENCVQMWTAVLEDTEGNQLNRVTLSLWSITSMPTPQQCGSIMTYMRRYGLQMLIGRVGEDDDDASSGQPQQTQRKQEPKQAHTNNRNVDYY